MNQDKKIITTIEALEDVVEATSSLGLLDFVVEDMCDRRIFQEIDGLEQLVQSVKDYVSRTRNYIHEKYPELKQVS